ncbi:MAG TPA: MFS transporter [Chloroflexota bacterium]|nr:MFS transporter [Chloroflexota bacterium]
MTPPLRRAFLALTIATFAYQFSFGLSRSVQTNFFVQELGLRADEMGLLTALRELLGLVAFAMAAATMRFAPPKVAAVCFAVMGVGYGAYGWATSFGSLYPAVMVASSGFHLWIPLQQAFGLSLAKQDDAGQMLGKITSVGWAASLASMLLVLLTISTPTQPEPLLPGRLELGYREIFLASGAILVLGLLAIVRFPSGLAEVQEERTVFRRRYGLFYLLNFLDGCRMEVFQAFGVFLLVKQYGIDVRTITLLFMVSSVCNMLLSQPVGRLIDRLGERRTLTFSYAVLLFVFLGFALVPVAWVAVGLYVVYQVVLLFSIGVTTYLKRIAPAADVRPSLAMGLTTMHISAVVLPPLGGLLWEAFGFQVPFLLGALFIGSSILATQRIPEKELPAVVAPRPAVG